LGSTIFFTATVTGPTSAIAPSGIGTWSITGASGVTSCALTTGPVGLLNVSTYTCSVLASRAGNYGATFTFPGDSAYNAVGVVASTTTTTVALATPTILISSGLTPTLGGSVVFTATVTGSTNALAPAGVMTFTLLGTAGATTCNSATGPISTTNVSVYTCIVLTPRAGTYIATANLAADSNYAAVSSIASTVTLLASAPVITLAASSNPVAFNQPAL
jgi:hypothetical protein